MEKGKGEENPEEIEKVIRQVLLLAFIILGVTACAGGIEDTNPSAALNESPELKIISMNPQNGQQNVDLNAQIILTFNQEVEPFFPAHRQNFELWTDKGERIPGNVALSGRPVQDPSGSGKMVSQVSIRPPNRYFLPDREYTLFWREAPGKGTAADATLAGIYARYGTPPDRLASGSVTFKTGHSFGNSPRPEVEVLAMAPGHPLLSSPQAAPSILDSIEGYLSILSNPRITLLMSEAVRHDAVDTNPGAVTAEMPATTICSTTVTTNCFQGVQIGVIDATTLTNDFLQEMATAFNNPTAWMAFLRDRFYGRLPGTVKTEFGRRQIVFELANGAAYPDNLAQAVIVILTGWKSYDSYIGVPPRTLKNDIFVGGFVHYTNFELPSGFMNIRQYLQGGHQ